MKHSQTPWIVDIRGGKAFISGSKPPEETKLQQWKNFAEVWVICDGDLDDEGLANAHLIANAPELLRVLREMVEAPDDDSRYNVAVDARRIIARATGRQ